METCLRQTTLKTPMCLAAAPRQTNHTGVITKSKEEECLMFLSARALGTKLDTFRAFPAQPRSVAVIIIIMVAGH